ncbi:hypothetical protein [Bradyrhizobium sp. McL0616]|uniref:hypothetical protein n=1 Tax=Bradyrhizobium sp. McL0616 TaxID=3415674 RepID=UPI003CF5E371
MAKRKDIFPSKFLKANDLAGKPLVLEIVRSPTETLGSGADAEQKTVLYFRGSTKPLPLNMVNWDSVAAIAGDDTDDWRGHRIELYPTTTTLRGSTVDCIRIRPPRQTERPQPQGKSPGLANADMDDDIPF